MPSPLSYVLAEPLLAVLFVAGDGNSRYGVDSSDEEAEAADAGLALVGQALHPDSGAILDLYRQCCWPALGLATRGDSKEEQVGMRPNRQVMRASKV